MEFGVSRHGSESQDSDEPAPPGTKGLTKKNADTVATASPGPQVSSKGIENAKKRLRAFSIQKKPGIAPVSQVKPVSSGNTTVLIGKLSAVKTTPKPEKVDDEQKKPPRPPKPGGSKKCPNAEHSSYTELQKKTLSEIEDMKRKMELVELGIPLGLICPSTNALPVKAMPTKAMPPIKTFLDSDKIDEIIREAKRAKAEGREFKFDYQKFVPDYDNPFQRKKELPEYVPESTPEKKDEEPRWPKSDRDKDRKDRFDKKGEFRKSDRYKHRDKFERFRRDRSKERDVKSRDREERSKDRSDRDRKEYKDEKVREKDDKHKRDLTEDRSKEKKVDEKKDSKQSDNNPKTQQDKESKEVKEQEVNLNDFLVCDSWSLDTDDKNTNSPQVDKTKSKIGNLDPLEQLRQSLGRKGKSSPKTESPKPKLEKLKPVVDSFKYEIDPNDDDELLDIFDEKSDLEKFNTKTKSRKDSLYDSPIKSQYDYERTVASDGINDDTFLESVINEIKLENMSDDENQDRGLVEYDESPNKDSKEPSVGSVTPELDDRMMSQSQRSDYSDGYRSIDSRKSGESGYKSSESGFKSFDSFEALDSYQSRSREKSYKSSDNSYKTSDNSYKTSDNSYKTSDNSYKTSDNSYKTSDTSYSNTETSQKSRNKNKSEELRLPMEKDLDDVNAKISEDTMDSLETWSFVLKICQPLLFRHDKNKCFKSTRSIPKMWYAQNPKLCNCVKDRSVVYAELEMCKMNLVDRLYGCDQITESLSVVARSWYPRENQCLVETSVPAVDMSSEWDIEEPLPPPRPSMTPQKNEDESLDREYQRFMEAVSWAEESKQESGSTTPVRKETRKKKLEDRELKKKTKKIKLPMTSDTWSQESEVEEEKVKPMKVEKLKEKRKRKLSPSTLSSESEQDGKKRKKSAKKKENKKAKLKVAKRRRKEKKMLKKLKEVKKDKKKKKREVEQESDFETAEKVKEDIDVEDCTEITEVKKKDKKVKKKKQRVKKKSEKNKKKREESTSSSSSTSSSDSSSSSDSDDRRSKRKKEEARRKKKEKKKRRKESTSDSQSEELFDVNILKNIKKEISEPRLSPLPDAREIIDVKELHHDFSHQVHIKQEAEEEAKKQERLQQLQEKQNEEQEITKQQQQEKQEDEKKEQEQTQEDAENKTGASVEPATVEPAVKESQADLMHTFDLGDTQFEEKEKVEFKESVNPQESEIPTPHQRPDETSQCSSQESTTSLKEHQQIYEKDESHLRPSSQNSNYSFNDVMASQYKGMEEKFEGYENYEMYEQLAMAYQSDVASQISAGETVSSSEAVSRIETVVRARGEIKCDWKPGDLAAAPALKRPSRWGLKPGDVNIVLTGGESAESVDNTANCGTGQTVYRIQSIANRDNSMGYDEAYMDMYGASDRLQYGDCFSQQQLNTPHSDPPTQTHTEPRGPSLDDRINHALRTTVLGEVAKEENAEKDAPEKGILVTKSLCEGRGGKRVSFADGYKPGQDSDVEEPPVKKRKKSRRFGCAWPCPASHPDHVPLWDALPPPPPPPTGSPPPPRAPRPPPTHLLRRHTNMGHGLLPTPPHHHHKFDPNTSIPNFMPPEPPPGLISFP